MARPVQTIVGDSLRPEDRHDPTGVDTSRKGLDQAFNVLDEHLAENRWVAGPDFTIADCAAGPALFYGRAVQPWDEGRLANLTRYRDLMRLVLSASELCVCARRLLESPAPR